MEIKRTDFDVYCGIDVGKTSHHLCAITSADEEIIASISVANTEAKIREAIRPLQELGRVLVSVDQKGDIARLALKVASSMGMLTAYLTPHDFCRYAATYSEVKSDSHDAFVIADLSMRMGRLLHSAAETLASVTELRLYTRDRAGLVADMTRRKNRVHGLLLGIHPPFARFIKDDGIDKPVNLAILAHYGGPLGIRRAGQLRLEAFVSKLPYYRNKGAKVADKVFSVLGLQDISLEGGEVAEKLVRRNVVDMLRMAPEIVEAEKCIASLATHVPGVKLLLGIPGIGAVFAPIICAEIGDLERFSDAGALAAYGGVAPSKRQSGMSMSGAQKKRKCNRNLKHAFCESAWLATQHDEASRRYYDKKRAGGKCHNQAVLALARHRTDIIYAVLKSGSHYEPAAAKR